MIDLLLRGASVEQMLEEGRTALIYYRPSGRVSAAFAPFAVLGLVVSALMAWVLYQCESFGYLLILTPMFLSLPILASLFLAIYFGRCRNVLLAGALAALVTTIFYVGYWLLSYYFSVVVFGVAAQQQVAEIIGVPGLGGYFLLRCKIEGLAHGDTGMIVSLIVRGFEFGIVLASALYLARRLSRRVYYEDYSRWASSRIFGFAPSSLQTVLQAIREEDWSKLESIEKSSANIIQRRMGYGDCVVEYLPGSTDQPAYLSVRGPVVPRWLILVLPFLARLNRRWISQRMISADSLGELKCFVGGLLLGSADAAAQGAVGDQKALSYWRSDQAIHQAPASEALVSIMAETGWGASTLVGKVADFRSSAVAASQPLIESCGSAPPSILADSSCGEAMQNPLPLLKRLSWIDISFSFGFLAAIVFGLIGIYGGSAMMQSFTPHGSQVFAAGWIIQLTGIGILLFHILFTKRFLRWLLMRQFVRRPQNLIVQPHRRPVLIRIEDPATFHVSKLTPEDWALCAIDSDLRRLLIEGVSHRYVIYGRDIFRIEPVQSGSSVSVRIDATICGTKFGMVVSRYGLGPAIIAGVAAQPIVGALVVALTGSPSARFARRLANEMRFVAPGPPITNSPTEADSKPA